MALSCLARKSSCSAPCVCPALSSFTLAPCGMTATASWHHAGKVPRHVLLFQSFGLGRGLSDHPRQTVPLHKLGIKTQSAALEGHGPEATGQQAQTVGIVVGGMVLDKDELPRWQRHRLCGDTTVDPHEGRAVFVIKAEPAGRPGHNVHKVPPVVTGPPDQFQRDETEEGSVQDAGNDGAQVGPLQVLYKTGGTAPRLPGVAVPPSALPPEA